MFVARPGTAEAIGAAVARRSVRNRWLWMKLVAIWIPFVAFMGFLLGGFGIGVGAVTIAVTVGVRLLGRGAVARNMSAQAAMYAGPGMVMASRFGPDALDIAQFDGHTRLAYDQVRGVYPEPSGVVVLFYSGMFVGFPRELFPDWAIEILRSAADKRPWDASNLPPLPPIPRLEQPTVVMVADAGTAAAMARAISRQMLIVLVPVMAVLAVVGILQAWVTQGIPGLVTALVIATALFGIVLNGAARGKRLTREKYARLMPPGEPLAVRFGTYTVELQTATFRVRHPYNVIRSLRLRGPAALLGTTFVAAYPRELFPEHAITHMLGMNPRIRLKR
ncbi:hypothetical protein GPX89_20170 [Nocardia sp. ET3-3]|uniref:Uncharacterized protein n=1 Tax=Nocardia terrae TaxID=2675851 RepID=A0A7K1UZ54_9NOCA|nr:YcxB family protein [Nocardia terrae]MVU79551.1 hypothetical protein [Nocardia terrae]